ASAGGAPAPRRPAARPIFGLLASAGGAPAPRRPAARPSFAKRLPELCGGDGCGAALHDDDAARDVRQRRRLERRAARGQYQTERADHRVAGAGDVGDLVGAVDRDEARRAVALEQRHAAATARPQADPPRLKTPHAPAPPPPQDDPRVEPLQQMTARLLHRALVVDDDTGELLELGL